jgi:hypothetical protein
MKENRLDCSVVVFVGFLGVLLLICNGCNGSDGCEENTRETCYAGPAGTENVGICRAGWRECIDGSYGECEGEVVPSASEADLCDGLDNDCDGVVDNVAVSPACGKQIGVCSGSKKSCVDGGWKDCTDEDYRAHAVDTLCSGTDGPDCCQSSTGGCYTQQESMEHCDSLDNDCNGAIDDASDGTCTCVNGDVADCPREENPNEGECVEGLYNCVDGKLLKDDVCVEPITELCDGKDNDCDGTVDGTAANDHCLEYPRDNASPVTCDEGVCIWSCQTGFGDCNDDLNAPVPPEEYVGDGCETELGSNSNCSACGDDCYWGVFPNAIGYCDEYACVMGACSENFDDCNSDDADGCEANLFSSDSHCGFCFNDCTTNFPHADAPATAGETTIVARPLVTDHATPALREPAPRSPGSKHPGVMVPMFAMLMETARREMGKTAVLVRSAFPDTARTASAATSPVTRLAITAQRELAHR